MKMADGGFRPAYNIQFASDCDAQVIVGVEVSTSGSDMAQMAPMVEQVEQRLVDGGFPAHEQIDAVADKTTVYAPVPEPRAKKDAQGNETAPETDKHQPKPGDSTAAEQWRERMARTEAKELYKLRAATAECVNAQARNRGLQRMPVRGLAKVRCVALLFALTKCVYILGLVPVSAKVTYWMNFRLRRAICAGNSRWSPQWSGRIDSFTGSDTLPELDRAIAGNTARVDKLIRDHDIKVQ